MRVAASDPAAQHAVADRMAAAPFGLKLPPDAELQPSNAVPKKPTQTPSSFRRSSGCRNTNQANSAK